MIIDLCFTCDAVAMYIKEGEKCAIEGVVTLRKPIRQRDEGEDAMYTSKTTFETMLANHYQVPMCTQTDHFEYRQQAILKHMRRIISRISDVIYHI